MCVKHEESALDQMVYRDMLHNDTCVRNLANSGTTSFSIIHQFIVRLIAYILAPADVILVSGTPINACWETGFC